MKIIGFNFTRIHIEKKSDVFTDLKVEAPSVDIHELKQLKSTPFNVKEDVFELKFTYKVKYMPEIANVELSGTILMMVDDKTSKEMTKNWKDKKLPDEHKTLIFNVILRKSSLKAIQLEDELNLPPHINMPAVTGFK